jgi:hypothetical protein
MRPPGGHCVCLPAVPVGLIRSRWGLFLYFLKKFSARGGHQPRDPAGDLFFCQSGNKSGLFRSRSNRGDLPRRHRARRPTTGSLAGVAWPCRPRIRIAPKGTGSPCASRQLRLPSCLAPPPMRRISAHPDTAIPGAPGHTGAIAATTRSISASMRAVETPAAATRIRSWASAAGLPQIGRAGAPVSACARIDTPRIVCPGRKLSSLAGNNQGGS